VEKGARELRERERDREREGGEGGERLPGLKRAERCEELSVAVATVGCGQARFEFISGTVRARC
jgi:hypothetical protein